MAKYNTSQRKVLLDFLTTNSEHSFTIDEISEQIKIFSANPPGKSTIYRLMPQLAEEGIVKKFIENPGDKATYQLMNGSCCHNHMHMKCVKCGKFFHMSNEESDRLLKSIRAFSDFDVDPGATLLFGRCSECLENDSERKGTKQE